MKKNKAAAFCTWYDRQDPKKRLEIRDRFIEESGMSYASWYPKIRSQHFSPLQMRLLEDITGKTFGI